MILIMTKNQAVSDLMIVLITRMFFNICYWNLCPNLHKLRSIKLYLSTPVLFAIFKRQISFLTSAKYDNTLLMQAQ